MPKPLSIPTSDTNLKAVLKAKETVLACEEHVARAQRLREQAEREELGRKRAELKQQAVELRAMLADRSRADALANAEAHAFLVCVDRRLERLEHAHQIAELQTELHGIESALGQSTYDATRFQMLDLDVNCVSLLLRQVLRGVPVGIRQDTLIKLIGGLEGHGSF
jgi:hypothetical protein